MSQPEKEGAPKESVSCEQAAAETDWLFQHPERFFAPGYGQPITRANLAKAIAAARGDLREVKGIVPIPLDDAHFAAIGKVVVNWAALELIIDSAVWQIAEIPDDIGASLTSQIGTFDSKIRALGAVLTVRNGFGEIVSALNSFSQGKTRALLELRNRVVHDAWIGDLKTGIPHRLTSPTKDKKGVPTLTYLQFSTETLNQAANQIAELIDKFKDIIAPAIERFPPLPQKSP
jgi:hypothetical protein